MKVFAAAYNICMEETETENNMVLFARAELDRLLAKTKPDSDGYYMQKIANDDIMKLVDVFSKQGDSRFSAEYKIGILEKLLRFNPISPLTGDDDEWNEVGYGDNDGTKTTYQNKRCGAVFKDVDNATGTAVAYYIHKYTVSDNGGITWFTPSEHKLKLMGLTRRIEFPFAVHKSIPVYIKYREPVPLGETSDYFTVITDDKDELAKVRERYERIFHPEGKNDKEIQNQARGRDCVQRRVSQRGRRTRFLRHILPHACGVNQGNKGLTCQRKSAYSTKTAKSSRSRSSA